MPVFRAPPGQLRCGSLYPQAQTAAGALATCQIARRRRCSWEQALAQEAAAGAGRGAGYARWGMTGWAGHDEDVWRWDLLPRPMNVPKAKMPGNHQADPPKGHKEAVLYTLAGGSALTYSSASF